ncbi:MAG: hypothetical protein M4D80_28505 [Myxococcota bacterium]|nr:hypothetical protein [Deltaproteobacteria bacterium]MDQ3339121.1 hypothetical protein [Myxococcota bacterium]
MNVDPAVRSVRIAVALCERFGELLKGPDKVVARQQHGSLVGVGGNEEEMSLRIGEVQQIYPEIWRHLDDARTAFAARGVDVAAFDQIRASEGLAIGAAVDMTRRSYGSGQHGHDVTVKSANFNKEGYARAQKATKALMAATPDIDWAAIAKAEADDPNIKAFTRSTTTKRYVMIGLLVALIASPFIYVWNARREKQQQIDARANTYRPPAPVDRTEIDKAIEPVRRQLQAARVAWATATTPEVLAAIKPSANPCEYKFDAPTAKAAESFVKYGSVDANYFGKGAFVSFMAGEPVRDQLIAGPLRELDGLANKQQLSRMPTHAVFVIVDKEVEPIPGVGKAFTPGEVRGRSYVFSIAQAKLVCAGVVDVRNTPALETSPQDEEAKQMLFRDLEMQIRGALATGLRAI